MKSYYEAARRILVTSRTQQHTKKQNAPSECHEFGWGAQKVFSFVYSFEFIIKWKLYHILVGILIEINK